MADKALMNSLFAKDWVVYAKRPFGGSKQVIEYLGRYIGPYLYSRKNGYF